jgi:two-component system, NtrC family, sensor kinase
MHGSVHSTETMTGSSAEYSLRVLLVDDQAMIGEAIRRALSGQRDLQFRYCGDPAKAIELAQEFKPTVILQDLVMPGVDGLTLLRQYRANVVTANVPIIVLSTKEDPAVKSEAFASGASDYLIKLPDPIELIARIRHHSKGYLNQLQRDAAYLERAAAQEQVLRIALQQQQLEEMVAQRLDSVGQLAAGVAHEINTPVQYISDNIRFVRDSVQELLDRVEKLQGAQQPVTTDDADLLFIKTNLPQALASSLDGLARISVIVNSLKEFSRPDQGEMRACDLNKAVHDTLIVASGDFNSVAELETHFGELPPVTCYAAEMHQALLNLVANAADAIGEVFKTTGGKGRLTVSTSCENGDAMIRITDTGAGILEDIRQKIFDPFFTTKEVGKGIGQGLTIARNIIVRKHGGALSFQSESGKGTTFIVRLPIEPDKSPANLAF